MTIPTDDSIDPAVRREVDARLAAVEATNDVRLLLAVESGSRAWGFPSPDSDYDVRILYVRRRDWYLSLVPGRDVIEAPITDEIDLSSWDVRKALGLLLRSNAVVSEWIVSPIRYRQDDPVMAQIAALADAILDPRSLARHYAGVARNAADRWLNASGDVPVKKYFYALRPALAIRALRHDPASRPPMNLQALVAASDLPPDLVDQIAELVEAKQRTNERTNGIRRPDLDVLIRHELGRVAELPEGSGTDVAMRAERLFLDLVNG